MSKRKTDDPADRVGFHVKMRNGLRAELAKVAKAKRASLGSEITARLEASLREDAARTIEEIAADLQRAWGRVQKKLQAAE